MNRRLDPRLVCSVLALVSAVALADGAQAQRQPNVQLTFRVVEANGFEDDDPAIRDVVSELREIFRFDGYRLLATSVINTIPFADPFTQYLASSHGHRFMARGELANDPDQDQVHRLQVDLYEGVDGAEEYEPLLGAAVNIRDGQTVVLGSARKSPESAALILVVTARFSY